jgi:ribosome-associated protein
MALLPVDDRLAIPEEDLSFLTSRSSGPGGQNVNKLETRVTVRFELASSSLTDDQRARLRERLATRITRAGALQVTAQRHRTQAANREAAIARLLELLREALAEAAPRRPTRISRAARARRLQAKRLQGERKRTRTPPRTEE